MRLLSEILNEALVQEDGHIHWSREAHAEILAIAIRLEGRGPMDPTTLKMLRDYPALQQKIAQNKQETDRYRAAIKFMLDSKPHGHVMRNFLEEKFSIRLEE